MDWQFGIPATLAMAAIVLVVGKNLIGRVAFLRKYSIPEPVVGGLLAALLVSLLHAGGVSLRFDTALQPGLMLAFFSAPILFRADLFDPHSVQASLMAWHPLTYFAALFQKPIHDAAWPSARDWGVSAACAAASLLMGGFAVHRLRSRFYFYL